MNASMYEMQAISSALDVELLELVRLLAHERIRLADQVYRDLVFDHDTCCARELAELDVIRLWKRTKEQTGAMTIEIEEKLPGFVAAGELFRYIARGTVDVTSCRY